MLSDLKLALRQLAKSPGFAFTAIATLALGIGANTAIFSVVNSALLRPLPFPDSDRLVQVWSKVPEGGHFPNVPAPLYKLWRDAGTPFESIALIHDRMALNFDEGDRTERIDGAEVSANYLDVLGVRPVIGRNFQPNDDKVGGHHHVILLTHEWWMSRFGGDRDIVGRSLSFNQSRYTVVGVLPPHTIAKGTVNFLVPLVLEDSPWRMDPTNPWAGVTARLKPGSTPAQANAEADAMAREFYAHTAPAYPFLSVDVQLMQNLLVEKSRPTFLLLSGAVTLVLLIACANVANLLLARGTTRRQEMAVRLALGASAGQIVRQVLTESVVLSLLGGAAGILMASFSLDLLRRMTASALPGMLQPELDGRVLLYSLLLACGTGIVFGLFPALKVCRLNLNGYLKDAGRGSTSGSRTRAQSMLIISEIALTVVLLIGTGLMLRSFSKVLLADAGFNPHQTLVCEVSLGPEHMTHPESLPAFERELVRRIRALPGVEAVGTTTTLPLGSNFWGCFASRSGRPGDQGKGSGLDFVGADYFRAMGMPLLQGRLLTEADNSTEVPRVVVVNKKFATALDLGANPVGQSVHFNDADWEVVGVVSSVRRIRVDAEADSYVYAVHAYAPQTLCLVVRTTVSPLRLVEDIRRISTSLDASQAISHFRTLEQAVSESLEERRVALYLIGIFGVVALGLACLGIYGVLAYTIGQRTRELSIRMALGAQRDEIVRFVLRDGFNLGAVGIGGGLLCALVGARILSSQLYEISAYDPAVFIAVAGLVALVTLLAAFIPARRATKVDPMIALRAE